MGDERGEKLEVEGEEEERRVGEGGSRKSKKEGMREKVGERGVSEGERDAERWRKNVEKEARRRRRRGGGKMGEKTGRRRQKEGMRRRRLEEEGIGE